MQHIWQFQQFNRGDLQTVAGEPLSVLNPGIPNPGQGPDFLGARIRVGETLWAGSVELHLRPGLWHAHGHDGDPHYENVVLHVVWENGSGSDLPIPVLELQSRVPKLMLGNYERLMHSANFIPCGTEVAAVDPVTWLSWKDRLLAERMLEKSDRVMGMLDETGGDWDSVSWWLLARQFGQTQNSDLFESMARSIPLSLLLRQADSLEQLEALLLGQCGLLHAGHLDAYPRKLWSLYQSLVGKHKLRPVKQPIHHFRMRPAGFPAIRLAQLAALLFNGTRLFNSWLVADDLQQVLLRLDLAASDYWNTHTRPDMEAVHRLRKTGGSFQARLVLNAVVPILFSYGLYTGKEEMKEKALHWAGLLPPEKNTVTDGFEKSGVTHASAFDSQALLQLHRAYCTERRCLDCAVGHALLRRCRSQDPSGAGLSR